MSWDAYVDDHLMYTLPSGHSLTSAAIIGHEGGVWASSAKFPELKSQEITDIVNAFQDNNSTLAQRGLFLGGVKYLVVQGEPGVVIRGKKGAGGVTIKKTNMAIVIGIYDEPVTGGECNTIVEKLGDYLLEQNY